MSRNGMYLWCAVINIDIKLTSQVGHLMWTSFFRRFLTASVVGLECWLHRSIYGSIATPKKESNKWNSGRNLKKKANLRWLIIRLHFFWWVRKYCHFFKIQIWQVRAWVVAGLPNDPYSIENGIIMDKAVIRALKMLDLSSGKLTQLLKNCHLVHWFTN